MEKVPFNLYDFFAYLSAGALWVVAMDYTFGLHWLLGQKVGVAESAFWLVATYVIGHVNAHWSGWLLEVRVLVQRMKPPSVVLFSDRQGWPPGYYRPLPKELQTKILDKYQRMSGSRAAGEAMFLFCYHLVKEKCPQANLRLQTFLNLYGFARNMSFATFGVAIMLAIVGVWRGDLRIALLGAASLVAAMSLFERYAVFFRAYGAEVFMSFLTGVREPPAPPPPA